MKSALSAAAFALTFVLASCLPCENEPQYAIPDRTSVCDSVSLADGDIDGAAEFERLFACLNNMGSLDEIEPMVNDLATTTNPATGDVYLEDLVALANAALADESLADLVEVAEAVVDGGLVDDVLPVGAAVIDSGFASELLPVVQTAIDSGATAQSLAPTAQLLRDPRIPELTLGLKQFLDAGIQEGWIDTMLPDLATMLTVQQANGDPALRKVVPPLVDWLSNGDPGALVPVTNQLLDTGTVDQLLSVTRTLADDGVLQDLDTQLRPLLVQDASGASDMQGVLEILDGTNGPLSCFGVKITDNLAEMILSTMADRTPQDIQNLVAILKSTLGLADLFCSLPPAVENHIDSLDALAKSGALNGLLPMLKVFKEQGQIGLLVDLLDTVHDSGTLPPLEPVLVAAIDANVLDNGLAILPELIGPDGTPSPALASLLELADLLVSPVTPGDPDSAPAASLLPLLGAANATAGGETALADALYLLGRAIQDPESGFDAVFPALSAALGADPDAHLANMMADLIESGTVERALPMVSRTIAEGHAEAMLPWLSRMIKDGTADSLLEILGRTFDLVETQS